MTFTYFVVYQSVCDIFPPLRLPHSWRYSDAPPRSPWRRVVVRPPQERRVSYWYLLGASDFVRRLMSCCLARFCTRIKMSIWVLWSI